MRQILWGLFKKVVIADNCGEFATYIFNNSGDLNGSTLVIGVFFFSIQIYGDFSGYSDIAIGTSRLFGFDLKQNFAAPYFSKNIVQFWRKWHISLTSWLTDYVFTPLALNLRDYRNKGILFSITVTFVLSGLWHGAGWNFVVYGLIHAFYYVITLLVLGHKKSFNSSAEDKIIPSLKDGLSMVLTFILVSFSYIFFRAENLSHALNYTSTIFSETLFKIPYFENGTASIPTITISIIFILVEWIGRKDQFAIQTLGFKWSRHTRIIMYLIITTTVFLNMGDEQQFIYFQF